MEDDNAWVFDSLVCFLNGPIWNAPLQSFIEEKSIIFEPNTPDDGNYQRVFEEYKNLVDLMLGSYMEDIGITPRQFEEACSTGTKQALPRHFDQNLFEQIWAANDYEMFKRLMTQRNVELQLQALELIEQKYGTLPQSFVPYKGPQPHIAGETKAEVSHGDAEETVNCEEEVMEEVMKNYPVEETPTELLDTETINNEVKYLLEEKEILQETLKKAVEEKESMEKMSLGAIPKKLVDLQPASSERAKPEVKIDMPTIEEISFDKKPITSEVDRLELKKRQDYLRAQRDKLVALKKEARKKQLDVNSSSNEHIRKSRPKSARAAQSVLAGNTASADPQQLQIRRALVERLRTEVLSKTDS